MNETLYALNRKMCLNMLTYFSAFLSFSIAVKCVYLKSFTFDVTFYFDISRQKLEAFLLGSMENELISDGVLAQDINQASSFWLLREVSIFHSMILLFGAIVYALQNLEYIPAVLSFYY